MSEHAETGSSVLDTAKLIAAVAILIGGIAAFYLLGTLPIALRWVIVLAALGAGIAVALQSSQGRAFWQFVQGSRVELRKVVWPTRQEATRTMWVVIAAVIIISLILAAFDWVIQLVVKALLGS